MERKTFRNMPCPIARTLDRVGEWWSILILRDAFHGLTRFDQFQESLEIAPNMLTRRLTGLVEDGFLERRRYNEHPPRYEYVLTAKGRDFWSVLVSLIAFGNRHFANDGVMSRVVDAETGKPVDPVLVDHDSGRVLNEKGFKFAAGPAADAVLKQRMRYGDERRLNRDARDEWDEYVRMRAERRQATRPKKRARK
jgi:DNA-binding HxlR family transcriptional regulator